MFFLNFNDIHKLKKLRYSRSSAPTFLKSLPSSSIVKFGRTPGGLTHSRRTSDPFLLALALRSWGYDLVLCIWQGVWASNYELLHSLRVANFHQFSLHFARSEAFTYCILVAHKSLFLGQANKNFMVLMCCFFVLVIAIYIPDAQYCVKHLVVRQEKQRRMYL